MVPIDWHNSILLVNSEREEKIVYRTIVDGLVIGEKNKEPNFKSQTQMNHKIKSNENVALNRFV